MHKFFGCDLLFYETFNNLCKKRNISKSKVLSEIGLSTGNLDKWKKGSSINSDAIIKIANYFDVSTDYILTGKDSDQTIDTLDLELLNLFRCLNDRQKERFLGKAELIINEMLEAESKKHTGT